MSTTTLMKSITVLVYSDPGCPWCHVGHKRLHKSIALLNKLLDTKLSIKIVYKPYIIDITTSLRGESVESYSRYRWGGSGWTTHVQQQGRYDGAKFSDWKWWPNSLKAHQLIRYATIKRTCDSETCHAVLMEEVFEQGVNISLDYELVRIGVNKLNITTKSDLQTYLEYDIGMEEVHEEISKGEEMYDIKGPPHFVLQVEGEKDVELIGAVETECLAQEIKKLIES